MNLSKFKNYSKVNVILLFIFIFLSTFTYAYYIATHNSIKELTKIRRNTSNLQNNIWQSSQNIATIEDQLNLYKTQVQALTRSSSELSQPGILEARIISLEGEIQSLKKNVSALVNTFLSEPEKALTIPMVQKDIKSLDKTVQKLEESTNKQFDRLYTLVGVLFPATIAIIAIIVSIRRTKEN